MTHLSRGDADLHYPNGEHRGTPPTTNGRALDAYEARITAHLAHHRSEDARLAAVAAGTVVGEPLPGLTCSACGSPTIYRDELCGHCRPAVDPSAAVRPRTCGIHGDDTTTGRCATCEANGVAL